MYPVVMSLVILLATGAFFMSVGRRLSAVRAGRQDPLPRTDRWWVRLGLVWTFAFLQKRIRYYPVAGLAHQIVFLGFLFLLPRSLILFGRGFSPDFGLDWIDPSGSFGDVYGFCKDAIVLLVVASCCVFLYFRVRRRPSRLTLNAEGVLILGLITTMMVADVAYDGAATALAARSRAACAAEATKLVAISESSQFGSMPQDVQTVGSGIPAARDYSNTAARSLSNRSVVSGPSVVDAAGGANGPPWWCGQAAALVSPFDSRRPLGWRWFPDPLGSSMASLVSGWASPSLVLLAQLAFWMHVVLVLVFLNLLPFTKHFHVLTAIPNVFLSDLGPPGRLRALAPSSEALLECVGAATEQGEGDSGVGYARMGELTWKDRLDLVTCTECGRCSDNCPAAITGKILNPKALTVALRGELISQAPERELVPTVIEPDVLWACTTCRACEEQCPVGIRYVDKIVEFRRNLVTIRGEHFPQELVRVFDGLETNGNPWNLPRAERSLWARGLDIPSLSERPSTPVLLWVGCAASFDPRAQRIARATARLLALAQVDFAILGLEETCTGDAARRAGNEYLYMTLAERNVATLNKYRQQGGASTIVALCPHCRNTLANEYPALGGSYNVVSHVGYLSNLVESGQLRPTEATAQRIVYHDSCYLGRYANEYDGPRALIDALPEARRVEPQRWTRQHAMCCGAGGSQMWLEEQNDRRINVERVGQLLDTGAETVASACPFCLMMLGDGLKSNEASEHTDCLDIAELLAAGCGLEV